MTRAPPASSRWSSAQPVPDVLQNVAVGALTGVAGLLVLASNTVSRE